MEHPRSSLAPLREVDARLGCLLQAGQVENLQRRKQRNLVFLTTSVIVLVVACLLRWVPHWNDLLAGRPQYAKAMTTLMAEEFANQVQGHFPVILLGEDDRCDTPPPTEMADDQVAGVLYLLTYSEQKHFSCVMTCIVPVDASKFGNLHTIRPEEGWTDGPRLLHPMKVLPVASSLHVYSPSYLQSLHWRVTPRFPLSEIEAAGLVGQHYESSNPSIQPEAQANMTLDFAKARALVRKPHDKVDSRLSLLLAFLAFLPLYFVLTLVDLYRKSSQCLRLYGKELAVGRFLVQDVNQRISNARIRYFEELRERQVQQRKEEMLVSLRQELEEKLRSALLNLHDELLGQRVEECLNAQPPDLDGMKQLWGELQKALGHKTPEERLVLLLESLKPYCTEEELNACRLEAQGILEKSGFREARKFAVTTHDQFRLREREVEELEESSVDSVKSSESIKN